MKKKNKFNWVYSAAFCSGIIALTCFTAWSALFLIAAVELIENWALTFYHIGSGFGGLAILAFGIYGIFGAPNKYEKTTLKVEGEKLALQKSEHIRTMKLDHAIDTLEAFEKAKKAIKRIRNPFSMSYETEELAKLLPEDSPLLNEQNRLKKYTGMITLARM